jgi:hypothetical protein
MIDEEAFADARPRMNVDARLRMRDLGDDAGDHRQAGIIKRVRQPVTDDGGEARKAEDDFVDALGGRIAFERRSHVRVEQRADGGKLGGEVPDDVGGAARRIDTAVAFPFFGQRQFELDLPGQRVQGPLERADDERVDIPVLKIGRAEMTRIERPNQTLDDVDDDLA